MHQTKNSMQVRIKHWLSKNKKSVIISGVIIALLIVGSGAYLLFLNLTSSNPTHNNQPGQQNLVEIPKPKYYSPLTGLEVADESSTKSAVTAIMIENSPDARPQSGLKESGVVFEAIAEGGITRFLALYQQEKPQLIGPVRSVRMYYVDWLAAFDASVAHIGGSAAALAEVRNGSYRDIDQFFNSQYYWRATDRYAPHNVYTSFEKLDALNQAKGYTQSNFQGFPRRDSGAIIPPSATNIEVDISYYLFNSSYVYDPYTNTYARYQAGQPHLDREKGQISPRVVVIIKVPMTLTLEDGYRQNYQTTGSNTAYIFQDGTITEAIWTKNSKSSQMTFTDINGNNIELARGQTWITAIPADTGAVSWQ